MILLAPQTIVEAPPVVQPESSAPAPSAAMRVEWVAPWLGRTWVLTDPSSPVVKLQGASGFARVAPTNRYAEPVTMNGSQHNGSRTEMTESFVPVLVQAGDVVSFFAEHDAFMASLDADRDGLLRVIRPDGQTREAPCRFAECDLADDLDVARALYAVYGITWDRADPFWRGEPVTNRYTLSTGGSIFPGPPFVIGRGLNLSDANVTNPGDVDAFPVYRVEGPFSGFTVGVGDSVVSMTLAKGEGQWVEVDMTPDRLTVVDESGVDRWDNLTDVGFSAIPPGGTTLTTSLVGAGPSSAVEVSFTPRYRGAW